jgi:type II secretory pathway pseudopilin PulG
MKVRAAREQRNTGAGRGQSLLETLIVVSVVLSALAIATAAFGRLAVTTRRDDGRAIALDAAQNAAIELLAAAAYDPAALAHVSAAQWQIVPPTPPAGAPASDAAAISLTLATQRSGDAQRVVIHFAGGTFAGDFPLTLRAVAPAPRSLLGPNAGP